MVCSPSSSSGFLGDLENSYRRRSIHFDAGVNIPMLPEHIWIVVRGIVKLSCLNEQGDDVLIAIAGPNEPFGDPLHNSTSTRPPRLIIATCLVYRFKM